MRLKSFGLTIQIMMRICFSSNKWLNNFLNIVHDMFEVNNMKRNTEKGHVFKQGEDSNYDYEFANELGAEIMKEKLNKKDEYINKLNKKFDLEVANECIPLHLNNKSLDDVQVFNTQNFYNRDEAAEERIVDKDKKKEN